MNVVNSPTVPLQEVAPHKSRAAVETMKRFFICVRPFVSLFVLRACEGSSAKGTYVFLLRGSHVGERPPARTKERGKQSGLQQKGREYDQEDV